MSDVKLVEMFFDLTILYVTFCQFSINAGLKLLSFLSPIGYIFTINDSGTEFLNCYRLQSD